MGRHVTSLGRDQKQSLKKHVATIHRSNNLSLLQGKISNALLYHAYPNLLAHEKHQILIKDLCKIIGYSGNNHAAIKDAVKGLISTVIEWNVLDEKTGEEDWTASSILASVNLKGAVCTYAYSPHLRKLLHSPTVYGTINMIVQTRFRSSYGLALYENCSRYRKIEHTGWFELEVFRKLMGVSGDNYTIFRDFKRRVLDKAVEEVNTYSDLKVEPELQRVGRKVIKLRFKIKDRKKQPRLGATDNEDKQREITNQLISVFYFSANKAQQLVHEYGYRKVVDKITMIQQSASFKQGRIKNLSAYLTSALKEDYQQKVEPLIAPIDQQAEQEQCLQQEKQHKQEVLQQFNDMDDDEREVLINKFEKYIAETVYYAMYERHGIENVLVQDELYKFVKSQIS